jgi:hypothetical protein
MTAPALRPLANEPAPQLDPARLAAANINPATGLATDYLNHFNEAIMMLDLMAATPACIDDLMAWRPMSYREHFIASNQKHRDLAVAAYEVAEPKARRRLDELASVMNAILVSTREALRLNVPASAVAMLAQDAATQLKPIVAHAGAVINGREVDGEVSRAGAPQAAVDALMER